MSYCPAIRHVEFFNSILPFRNALAASRPAAREISRTYSILPSEMMTTTSSPSHEALLKDVNTYPSRKVKSRPHPVNQTFVEVWRKKIRFEVVHLCRPPTPLQLLCFPADPCEHPKPRRPSVADSEEFALRDTHLDIRAAGLLCQRSARRCTSFAGSL